MHCGLIETIAYETLPAICTNCWLYAHERCWAVGCGDLDYRHRAIYHEDPQENPTA